MVVVQGNNFFLNEVKRVKVLIQIIRPTNQLGNDSNRSAVKLTNHRYSALSIMMFSFPLMTQPCKLLQFLTIINPIHSKLKNYCPFFWKRSRTIRIWSTKFISEQYYTAKTLNNNLVTIQITDITVFLKLVYNLRNLKALF